MATWEEDANSMNIHEHVVGVVVIWGILGCDGWTYSVRVWWSFYSVRYSVRVWWSFGTGDGLEVRNFQDMAPDTKVPDGRTAGQRQNNIPPPLAGDNDIKHKSFPTAMS
ncbi:hypothetical protein DPMN_079274 [Dreissena polymorpha]|uniref:Uncharacterized protein n=1 Tax=Dreissena polymorpha TaxID=45954 RepID=A0A9D3YU65_DREPO|nr:hypothetical protein DPMN_079274 [Dreissena polymorpha]